ncbi:MAG: hypothetical protein HUK18_02600 [Bacteroidales bacterium]|nr:hypothetical protein [Bacteroidales bacterium]
MKSNVLFLLAMSCLFVANAQNPSWNSSVSTVLTDNIQSEKFQQKIKVYNENTAFALTKKCNSKYYIEELVDTQVPSNKIAIGVDSIFDMAILNDHIYFVGKNNNDGFIGKVRISALQSGSGYYELTPTPLYTIRTIKAYNDSNGKQHVVGIGRDTLSTSQNFYFFDFNDANTPNFELKPIQILRQVLCDLDITDKYIAVVGYTYGVNYHIEQSLIRIDKSNTSSIQGYAFDHTPNAFCLLPDSCHEKMLVRHTINNEVVIMMNAYDTFINFSTFLNCVNLNNLNYIYSVQSILHEEKDMKIRDAVYHIPTTQMFIVEDCTIKSIGMPQNISYIMHSQPYLQTSYMLDCFFDFNNFTYFNCIDKLHSTRYIVAGVAENCVDSYIAVKDITQNIGNCFRKFSYKVVPLTPITANSMVSTIVLQALNPSWNLYQSPIQNKIKVKCY